MPASPIAPLVNTGFYQSLKLRLEGFFEKRRVSPRGGMPWLAKALVFSAVTLGLYVCLLLLPFHGAVFYTLCVVLGLLLAGVGFNVMHDAAHGSASRFEWVNRLGALSLEFLGGSTRIWRAKHNTAHHTHTNVVDHDDDINVRPWLRLSPGQPRHFWHRAQHLYAPVLYSLTHTRWVLYQDFLSYFQNRVAGTAMVRAKIKDHLVFWGAKVLFALTAFTLPILTLGWQRALIGYAVISASTGLVMALTFQLAHIVEGVDFPEARTSDSEPWAVTQMRTTANFSAGNPLVTFFTGGLNHQVEHHLFARISHIHYPKLVPLVKETCAAHNVPYHHTGSAWKALGSHFRLLWRLGNYRF